MASMVMKSVVRDGHIETEEPIDLPDGSEVTILREPNGVEIGLEDDRPRALAEIAATWVAMELVEPFDMTDDERAVAEAWEKTVNDYSIAKMEKGLEDDFRRGVFYSMPESPRATLTVALASLNATCRSPSQESESNEYLRNHIRCCSLSPALRGSRSGRRFGGRRCHCCRGWSGWDGSGGGGCGDGGAGGGGGSGGGV